MKLYDSKEIRVILKKAAENSSTDDDDTPIGLSIDELKQIASETGIDPKQVALAAAEIDLESENKEPTFWGGPFSFKSQVMIENEITTGQWEEMLISIRDFFQSKGEVTTRDSVLEWSSPWGTTNSAHVTALKQDGKTKISVNWSGPLTAVPFYIPVPLVAIASLFFASEFLVLAPIPGVAFTLLATGLTFLTGRWALRKHLDKGLNKLREMVVGLDLIASSQIQTSDTDLKQSDNRQVQTESNDPFLNIDEGDNHKDTDNGKTPRNRSKT